MNYQETIEYLYRQLPVFHRVGKEAYRPGLKNIEALCEAAGNPQRFYPSVHVGGTNGKGSVSHMLAAIFQTAGYRTGLYTSPHLLDFRERIRVNGEMIPEAEVVRLVEENLPLVEAISPSFFELTVAMAFSYFAARQVDIAIVEVGMGGRLDSTNILLPRLSVITNIGYDHMHVLGNSLEEIAGEKAGIIKAGIPVVVGEWHPRTAPVFLKKSRELNASLHFASEEWEITEAAEPEAARPVQLSARPEEEFLCLELRSDVYVRQLKLELDLTGAYQRKNIKTVLSAAEQLKACGYRLEEAAVREALRKVKSLTGLSGRWQIVGRDPLVVCDTGHNEDGIQAVLNQIAITPHRKLHLVFGMVSDKDVSRILDMLPGSARYYFCQATVPRAMDAESLRAKAAEKGLQGKSYPAVSQALDAAIKQAEKEDLILVGGSTFVVADALAAIKK